MKKSLTLALFCLLLATVVAGVVSAQNGNGKGNGPPEGVNLQISTENFTVRFEGRSWEQVPKFKYWYNTEDENRTIYQVFFHQIFEFNDTDGDGIFNATLGDKKEKMFALPSGDQSLVGPVYITNVTSEEVIGVRFNFTILGRSGPSKGVNMTLQCSLYNKTQTITGVGGTIYNVTGGAELKIDVIINSWPFKNNKTKLCLRWSVNEQNETVTPSFDPVAHRVTLGGGYFKWLSNATVYNATGFPETKPVNSSFAMIDNTVNVYLCYPNFKDGSLIHDPSLGVMADAMPPTVSIQQSPTVNIAPGDYVTIAADVEDEASGVKSVQLMYSVDGGATWNSIKMTLIDGEYLASIPGQEEGTTVKYYVIVTDFAGNQKVSDITTYTIMAPGLDSWMIYGVAFIAIFIAIAAYYIAHKGKQPSIFNPA